MEKKRSINAEEFIKVWQTATDTKEVATRLGIKPEAASAKAAAYRKHEIPLKHMRFTNPKDWKKLAEVAKQFTNPVPA